MDFSYLLEANNYEAAQDLHADFNIRAESLNHTDFIDAGTDTQGTESKLDIFESALTRESLVRLTGIVTVSAGHQFDFGNYQCGFEIMVLHGTLRATTTSNQLTASVGDYLRIPYGEPAQFLIKSDCRLLIKLGQMSDTDREVRLISTDDKTLWLPGPVEGTEVLPLHLHDTKSALLIRWLEPAYFKPQLDPLGEELFVINGTLHDAYGSYEKGSWIRNPVPAWQSWGGQAETMVYYKNGHFPVA